MGQEFFIKSSNLENKVRELLPSQGGLGAGFDLSASTQIIPIIDLTESAEGSNVRQDLQTALSHSTITAQSVNNATVTLINNTGYFRIFGICSMSSNFDLSFQLNDGSTTKVVTKLFGFTSKTYIPVDFNVFLSAGDSLECVSSGDSATFSGSTRQIADIDGNLVDP